MNKKILNKDSQLNTKVFAFIGVLAIIIGIGTRLYNYTTFIKNGIETIATVTNVEKIYSRDHDSHTSISYKVTVNFDCGDVKNISSTTNGSSSTYNYNKGEKIEIYCQTGKSQFLIKDKYWLFPVIAMLIGVIFSSISITFIYTKIKQKKAKEELTRMGIFKEFPIKEISQSGIKINNKTGYYLVFENGGYTYKTETFRFNIYKYIDKDEKFQIYYDPQNPEKHWINTDSIYEKKNKF